MLVRQTAKSLRIPNILKKTTTVNFNLRASKGKRDCFNHYFYSQKHQKISGTVQLLAQKDRNED